MTVMTQMNIQLANVLSDVSGITGQAIVKAILTGERDPHQLAGLRNCRVKASEEEIARSLESNWQEDLLFVLKQEQDGYEFCQKQMAECDQRLQRYLQQRADRSAGAKLPEEKRKERLRKKKKGNAPQFDLRTELFRTTGTDLTQIDGIDVMTATTILSEAGWDMSKWKTEHHFVSWLRLCPDNQISGDKVIAKGRLPTNNRVTTALRMAASTLRLSNTYLGAQFRRLRTRLGARLRSRLWPPSLPDWSTACSATACNSWTKERSSTRPNIASYRSTISSGKPATWGSRSSKLPQLKGRSFWRELCKRPWEEENG
jgi:transposase